MHSNQITPGEVARLPLGAALTESSTAKLLKTPRFELIRLVLPRNKEIAPHKTRGEITVHCLEGVVEFTCHEKPHELRPGTLIYLEAGQLHALKALEDSTLLVTHIFDHSGNP